MLTVKVEGIHGDDSVFQARHIIAYRRTGRNGNVTSVECLDDRYEAIIIAGNRCITFGTVYVMNDNGKTVAVYYLAQE